MLEGVVSFVTRTISAVGYKIEENDFKKSIVGIMLPYVAFHGNSRQVRISDEADRHSAFTEEEDTRWEDFVRPQSPCEISNDPAEAEIDPLATCGVTEYFCRGGSSSKMEVLFEYDIYTATTVPELQAIDFVEERIFRETAETLGIDDCHMYFRRRRLRRAQELPYQDIVASVETAPKDDTRPGICFPPNESSGLESAECVPVLGGFSVYGDGVGDLKRAFLEHIKDLMDKDAFVVDPLIKKVVYVGEPNGNGPPEQLPGRGNDPKSELDVPAADDNNPPSNADSLIDRGPVSTATADRSSATAMLVVAVAGLAVIVLFVFLAVSRLRRSKRKNRSSDNQAMAILEEPDYMFDLTDNLPHYGLADRDSLALVPQGDLPDDLEEEALAGVQAGMMCGNVDKNVLFGASDSEGSRSDNEDSSSALSYIDDSSSLPEDGRVFAVGAPLSSIEEDEAKEDQVDEDHNLDFEEIASTASHDTRSSARRVLQMT